MPKLKQNPDDKPSLPWGAWILVLLGALLLVCAWQVPSRFNSIPAAVLRSAGLGTESLEELWKTSLAEGELGVAAMMSQAKDELGVSAAVPIGDEDVNREIVNRWGVWDPFLDAAFASIPVEEYSQQPGAIGIMLSRPCREAMSSYLEYSRSPLVAEILATGELQNYNRFFPVYSASGRPLEATILVTGLLAQSDVFSSTVKKELRVAIYDAKSGGDISRLEDFYLDMLSLGRMYNWGQLRRLVGTVESLETFSKLRYSFHRMADEQAILYAASVISGSPDLLMSYLAEYGDAGGRILRAALSTGAGSLDLLLREQLLVEDIDAPLPMNSAMSDQLAAFSLKNPHLSLSLKYGLFFMGAFVCFWGGSRFGRLYRESASPVLVYTQRTFASLASLLVLIILSEPNLAGGKEVDGFSFSIVVPVLAQVDGELQIIETTPTTTMALSTILSICFFFILQLLVFFICLLKVREIDRREVDSLLKLRLMENEENLFDTGLYVGIAGTCISLVLQVLNLIDANLIAAYSSNLFGILCVAIVKIRLVRPYKNRLILESEERLIALSGGVKS